MKDPAVGPSRAERILGEAYPSRVRRVQELRRSNAATPVPSKKKYTRKKKHKKASS